MRFSNGKVWRREREETESAFTSGPLLLRIIDHYHLCDLEWDKGERWLHLENQTGSVHDLVQYTEGKRTDKGL